MMPLKALIIDDVKLIRIELRLLLSEFNVIEVIGDTGSLDDAFTLIQQSKPDVIFLDICFPEASGFELLNKIDKAVKVIFISSYFYKYSKTVSKYNPVAFLNKPISKKKLAGAIRKLSELAAIY